VISPFAAHQFLSYKFLHDIPRQAVEDEEERFVAEARDSRLERLDIGNVVAGWKGKILLQRDC
jgi:hypothetical protein